MVGVSVGRARHALAVDIDWAYAGGGVCFGLQCLPPQSRSREGHKPAIERCAAGKSPS